MVIIEWQFAEQVRFLAWKRRVVSALDGGDGMEVRRLAGGEGWPPSCFKNFFRKIEMAVLDAKDLIVFRFSAFEYYFINFIVEAVFYFSRFVRSVFHLGLH